MEETPTPTPTTNYGEYPCIFTNCDNSTSCTYTCYTSIFPLPLPPPPLPPPPPQQPPSSHMAPFLIATICILGISFLLLSTCTVILRLRFTGRRRVVTPETGHDDSLVNVDHSIVDHPIWYITTVGLQQSVIDSITAFKFNKKDGFFVDGGSDSSCSVCLTDFDDGDDLRLLPKCNHAFHVSCIDTWLSSHKNCPLCRAPVVNETEGGDFGSGLMNSSNSSSGEDVRGVDLEGNIVGLGLGLGFGTGRGEGSNHHDELGELPMMEGIKIAEVLRKNRELRILSDLSENHRFRVVGEGFEPVKRSVSFNSIAASVICGGVVDNEGCSSDGSSNEGCSSDGSSNEGCSSDGNSNEGCSSDGNSKVVVEEKRIDIEKAGNKRGSSMSGLLMKSSSIGRSLQKGPISMKRSLSSSSKFFSFRRTKSQASILPL